MKKIRSLVLVCFILTTSNYIAYAQVISFNLATVPDSIKKDADVVIQFENQLFTVEDIDKASLYVHKIYTVVDEDGDDELNFYVPTSKFRSLADAELKAYDANGKLISRVKKKDMSTQAMGEGLVDDGYVTYYYVSTNSYPVTIDIEYTVNFKGTLFYPAYQILVPHNGVLQSSFTARVPPNLDLRYKPKNTKLTPEIKNDSKYKIYTWSVKNLVPIEYEESAVTYQDRYPSIVLAPNHFKMDDYEGDMTSWQNFGKWYASLKKGIDVLPEDKKAFFRNLTTGITDEHEKIRVIYEYMQKNFRYVSIQLGIGGYKPFPASFTESKKYGDCKGLSNFMQAALDGVGIKSYQALINRESNGLPVEKDFPHSAFNHVILLVPLKNDSVWLECTSNSLECGTLDITTENKNALVVTESGGVLIATPKSTARSNSFYAFTKINLDADGSGEVETTFKSCGEYRDMMESILKEKRDDQKESIVLGLSFKQPEEFEFSQSDVRQPHTSTLKMFIGKVPEFSAGNKVFLSPRLYKIWNRKLPKTDNRRLDFYFNFPFEKTDTTVYILPKGYKPDVLPAVKNLSTDLSSYESKSWYVESEGAVYSTVKITLLQHVVPASKFAEIKKFFDDVMIADGQKIVVLKE